MRPFKAKEVEDDSYYEQVLQYIHLNPVNHGYVDDLENWPYSSYHEIKYKIRALVNTDLVLKWHGGYENFVACY